MRAPEKQPSFVLRCAWALALAGVFVAWSAKALSPFARLWLLADTSQAGQLGVFNRTTEGGFFGMPVELGDYDGDGAVDIAVAPMGSSGGGLPRPLSGEVYIYKGDRRLEGKIDRAEMPPASPAGLTVSGARPGDFLGTELFTADVNGDGIRDLLISAQNYDGPAGDRDNCGGVFVILGGAGILDGTRRIDTAVPTPGVITIFGQRPGDRLGIWVEAGDLDGDGLSDILMGADQAPAGNPMGETFHTGMVFVIYGREIFPPVIDLASAASSLPGVSSILGRDGEDHFGSCLHARDLNRDGQDELIAASALNRLSSSQDGGSAFLSHATGGADGPGNLRPEAGEVTILFSSTAEKRLPRSIDLSALTPDLARRVTTIHGRAFTDLIGEEIATGDFNGDGFPDLALGGLTAASPVEPFHAFAGVTHVIYWREGLEGMEIDLVDAIRGMPNGLVVSTMHGIDQLAILGDTLTSGDFDHDGFDDLAVGVPHAAVGDQVRAGIVAVAFGRPQPWPTVWAPQADVLPPGLQLAFLLGRDTEDLLSYSMEARDYDGDGYSDLFPNAMRGDGSFNQSEDCGEAYLVSGFRLTQGSEGPAIEGIEPADGPSSSPTAVVIAGRGFTTEADTRVFVGGREAASPRVVSGRRIEVLVPASDASGPAAVTVVNRYGTAEDPDGFTYLRVFLRGDTTLDGILNISDPIAALIGLFLGGPLPCFDASDADDDGKVDITDALHALQFLFLGGRAPAPPFPEPGVDPTPDELSCP